MSLFAIGDLHLSFGSDKPMDIFGPRWKDHAARLQENFAKTVAPEDTTVICGDLTWSMDLPGALEDFLFIHRLPGKKIILKGNHDYWWSTASKAKRFFAENGIDSIDILNNNCFFYGEDLALCGTRGWFYEEERGTEHDKKILLRELGRLETSLQAAGERRKYVFLHYPPKYGSYACREILDLLRDYRAELCCAGHIHGPGCQFAFENIFEATAHRLVSADHLAFQPLQLPVTPEESRDFRKTMTEFF